MRNLAVLLQLVGLILTFSIGVAGYVIGPLIVIGGGVLYRKETKKIETEKSESKNYPKEIDKWNWAAFFFNWIWGIGNKVYISLLCFIPIVNIVFIFILGSRGNRWAWEKGNWESIEEFQAAQRKWALWIIPVYTGIALLSIGIVFGISSIMKSTDAYQMGIVKATNSTIVKNTLGEPLEIGFFVMGSIETQGVMGKAKLSVPISGPKGSGDVYISAMKDLGVWKLNEIVLILDETNKSIYLLE